MTQSVHQKVLLVEVIGELCNALKLSAAMRDYLPALPGEIVKLRYIVQSTRLSDAPNDANVVSVMAHLWNNKI